MQIFVLQIVIANGAISHKTSANFLRPSRTITNQSRYIKHISSSILRVQHSDQCSISLEKPHPFPTRFLSLTNYQCTGGLVGDKFYKKNHVPAGTIYLIISIVGLGKHKYRYGRDTPLHSTIFKYFFYMLGGGKEKRNCSFQITKTV